MRLLVPMRISIALRMATCRPIPSGSAAPTTRSARKHGSMPAAAAVSSEIPTSELLQQLWEMSRLSTVEPNKAVLNAMHMISNGNMYAAREAHMPGVIKNLSGFNDFSSIAKLLEGHGRAMRDAKKMPIKEAHNHQEQILNMFRAVNEVLWAGSFAKSLGCLPPSFLTWLEEAVQFLPEPVPIQKESMLWLLSIIRNDLPMLQQLQRKSSKNGRIGPEIEREKTLRHVALTYLEAGKEDEFRSLWTSSGTPVLLDEQHESSQPAAILHHALLRRTGSGKPDPAMLRWYAESLAANQRTPIPAKPQFETMMVPMIKNLGGKIEKWMEDDKRTKKLRKWRDDYDDSELDRLQESMTNYMAHQTIVENCGHREDLSRLYKMLGRLEEERGRRKERKGTVVVDWLNIKHSSFNNFNLLPSHSLVVVGREQANSTDFTVDSPKENKRVKVMEVTRKREKKQEVDDLCALILAVATRGHLLTNDKTRPHLVRFSTYLKRESEDTSLAILLKNYLNDAVLRHYNDRIQPVVDHSRAAQWIDEEKKELAFTVARATRCVDSPYRLIEYYSLHID